MHAMQKQMGHHNVWYFSSHKSHKNPSIVTIQAVSQVNRIPRLYFQLSFSLTKSHQFKVTNFVSSLNSIKQMSAILTDISSFTYSHG